MRATKIVATLGPATDHRETELLAAGVDVVRVNFSHGSHSDHTGRVERIRAAARSAGRYVAVLGDLQGPKIRISGFAGGSVMLVAGATFHIDASLAADAGTVDRVGSTYPTLADEVQPGNVLVLGDGLLELEVTATSGTVVTTRVLTGGELGAGKGINLRGGGLAAPALTDKDRIDLQVACDLGLEYLAVSFPRSGADMREARRLVEAAGGQCGLVAKVERAEALTELDDLIIASDAVMVARGDLGIEIGDAALMAEQKRIIRRARELNCSVITATQMMESMITNPRPTRAEVMDVANAVVDGTDAVMLSGETAVGDWPVDTVRVMAEIIVGAEATSEYRNNRRSVEPLDDIDIAIAHSAMQVAATLRGVTAVACLTGTGNTPKLMSRMRSGLPIYAMADSTATLSRVALYRGVHPVEFAGSPEHFHKVDDEAVQWLLQHGAVAPGDRVILTKGDRRNVQGGTNTMRVIMVRTPDNQPTGEDPPA